MNLNQASFDWAINHILKYGDSDLFPKPYEIEAISKLAPPVAVELSKVDISNYFPSPARRFIVPKEDLSYRAATQLDPLDSIFLTAIIHQFGACIEARRRLIPERRVFSYRFSPDSDGNLYRQENSWNLFWQECKRKAFSYQYAIVLDISDFYNQIYHHTVENQLIESGFPNQAKNWIMNLLESLTAKTSRLTLPEDVINRTGSTFGVVTP